MVPDLEIMSASHKGLRIPNLFTASVVGALVTSYLKILFSKRRRHRILFISTQSLVLF